MSHPELVHISEGTEKLWVHDWRFAGGLDQPRGHTCQCAANFREHNDDASRCLSKPGNIGLLANEPSDRRSKVAFHRRAFRLVSEQ